MGEAEIIEIHFYARLEHKGGFGRANRRGLTPNPGLTAPGPDRARPGADRHAGSLTLPTQPPLTLTFVGSEKKGPLA